MRVKSPPGVPANNKKKVVELIISYFGRWAASRDVGEVVPPLTRFSGKAVK